MTRAMAGRGGVRAIAHLLALIALAVSLAIPPGFMVQSQTGVPSGLVICTGHGALDLAPGAPDKQAPQKTANDLVCAFAAHMGGALTPPCCASLGQAFAFAAPVRIDATGDIVPGRGLAAPPPPAHAPPSLV